MDLNDKRVNSPVGMSNQKMRPEEGSDGIRDVFQGASTGAEASDQPPEFSAETSNAEFEKHWYFSSSCVSIRRFINFIGAITALLNVALDIVYAYKINYVLKLIYVLTCVFIVVRIVFTLGFG